MFGGNCYHKLKLESFGGAVPLVSVRVKLFVTSVHWESFCFS